MVRKKVNPVKVITKDPNKAKAIHHLMTTLAQSSIEEHPWTTIPYRETVLKQCQQFDTSVEMTHIEKFCNEWGLVATRKGTRKSWSKRDSLPTLQEFLQGPPPQPKRVNPSPTVSSPTPPPVAPPTPTPLIPTDRRAKIVGVLRESLDQGVLNETDLKQVPVDILLELLK